MGVKKCLLCEKEAIGIGRFCSYHLKKDCDFCWNSNMGCRCSNEMKTKWESNKLTNKEFMQGLEQLGFSKELDIMKEVLKEEGK